MNGMVEETPQNTKGFSIFTTSGVDEIEVSRIGKQITVKSKDGAFQSNDSVESNLLFEILRTLQKL